MMMCLWGRGHFFHQLVEKQQQGTEHLLKVQNNKAAAFSSRTCRNLPKTVGQSSGSQGSRPALKRSLNQVLLERHALGSTCADPHLGDFLENHFLDEEMKVIKKMGDHLTNILRLAAPQAGLSEYLFKRLTLKHD